MGRDLIGCRQQLRVIPLWCEETITFNALILELSSYQKADCLIIAQVPDLDIVFKPSWGGRGAAACSHRNQLGLSMGIDREP